MSEHFATCCLEGFDDPRLNLNSWNSLLARSDSNVVFLTYEWQRAWWESFERSGLMLIMAVRAGEPVALAPFFTEEGWIYFVGSGGSDYLDFIGAFDNEGALEVLLTAAIEQTPSFSGMKLYHVLEHSRTGERLRLAAARLGLHLEEETGMPAPALDLTSEAAQLALRKKSLVRHENFFRREASAILPRLDAFFAQHVERWRETQSPSLFQDERQRRFYRTVTERAAAADWLRFTEVRWKERPIAFHFGMSHAGTYLWYKPSFDIALARHSPGEVLLRQLLLVAIEEGAHTFDFGLGDEAFKSRFATHTRRVCNWTLTP